MINFRYWAIALFIFTSCHAQDTPKDTRAIDIRLYSDTLFKQVLPSRKAFGGHDYHRELLYIKKIMDIDSLDNGALQLKAQIFANRGKYDSAIQILNVLVDHKHLERIITFRGALYDIVMDTAKARADYKAVLSHNNKLFSETTDTTMKVRLLGSMSFFNLLLGADKAKVMSAYNYGTSTLRNPKTENFINSTRSAIATFTREGFLKSYRLGNL